LLLNAFWHVPDNMIQKKKWCNFRSMSAMCMNTLWSEKR